MSVIRDRLVELVRDERGATAIEYALIVGAVAAVIVAAVNVLGTTVLGQYASVAAAFTP